MKAVNNTYHSTILFTEKYNLLNGLKCVTFCKQKNRDFHYKQRILSNLLLSEIGQQKIEKAWSLWTMPFLLIFGTICDDYGCARMLEYPMFPLGRHY
jgi:hypothetical protein